jgi:hypothetical protein
MGHGQIVFEGTPTELKGNQPVRRQWLWFKPEAKSRELRKAGIARRPQEDTEGITDRRSNVLAQEIKPATRSASCSLDSRLLGFSASRLRKDGSCRER